MDKIKTNKAASVKDKLLRLAKAQGQPFDVMLVRYGLERFLYRLSISKYRDRFILKGGLLVTLWVDDAMRVTRDVDLLGQGDDNPDRLKETFAEIFSIEVDDGLTFDPARLIAEAIREEVEYGGTRLKTVALLEKTRISITIDIGFGDAVAPAPMDIDFPNLLDREASSIRAYPPTTVIAEKFQAMVNLGLINGRMKDYYDIWAIPQSLSVNQDALDAAIEATFSRRGTAVPTETPPGLSDAMYTSHDKLRQWEAYARSIEFDGPPFQEIVQAIWELVGPACARINTSA
ncbi:MAG: nucleotidyl transferase AbiEii/AbiGii toxin family protein [Asticcacaulis sp.]|nr:nucleotidyl transferase AbiEii/AbiGii toxin family protein [Asticcacaulis sp.]